jgi:Lon protease-like protein
LTMLPPTIPLFPLPNVVLFPGVFLPLHIFEPRYRAMIGEALDGDRLIGMVLLKPGYEAEYEGRPPIYPIGCSGLITHAERLADGRFNIVLQGLERFRVREEDDSRVYRVGIIERLSGDTAAASDEPALRELRHRIEHLLTPMVERAGGEINVPPSMTDVDVIHALAQYLDLAPIEKQALLERDTVLARAAALADLLEMKAMTSGLPGTTSRH